MDILAPIFSINEMIDFYYAGADEFYVGYTPTSWLQEFNGPLNQKGTIYAPINSTGEVD